MKLGVGVGIIILAEVALIARYRYASSRSVEGGGALRFVLRKARTIRDGEKGRPLQGKESIVALIHARAIGFVHPRLWGHAIHMESHT